MINGSRRFTYEYSELLKTKLSLWGKTLMKHWFTVESEYKCNNLITNF